MPRSFAMIFRGVLWTVGAFLLFTVLLLRGSLWLTRMHMQHLLADFHTIYPTQSTWADAQRIMHRWGRWGNYDGTCSSQSCTYSILIQDAPSKWFGYLAEHELIETGNHPHLWAFIERFGMCGCRYLLRMTTSQGRIVQTETGLIFTVPPKVVGKSDDYGYALMLAAIVRSRLKVFESERHSHWILGNEEQLEQHPDYKVGRPGGCEICMSAELTYTPKLAPDEIVRLTSYNFSCVTRWRPCSQLGDLLPAARKWNLYREDASAPGPEEIHVSSDCHTDPRALGRDAQFILEAKALATHMVQVEEPGFPAESVERSTLQVLHSLKGKPLAGEGQVIDVEPFSGSSYFNERPEHMVPGQTVLVLLDEGKFDYGFRAPRCGILLDTPATLDRIHVGIAEDVPLSEPNLDSQR